MSDQNKDLKDDQRSVYLLIMLKISQLFVVNSIDLSFI